MSAPAAAVPSGVVTFLFTDMEGSTRRWESDAEGMRAELAAHDEVLRSAIEAHGGSCSSTPGRGVCGVRLEVRAAIARCCDNCLHAEPAVVLGSRDRADRNSRWLLAQ